MSQAIPMDTHPEAWAVYIDIYRRMSGVERLDRMAQMSDDMRDFFLAGLRHRHPQATEEEIIHMERQHRLGKELADTVWPRPK